MGHSQAEKAATHQRIVEVAARRFRELGLDGIGVADVMKDAGLTVGGFYKHFDSRDDLVVQALAASFVDVDGWEFRAKASLRKAIRQYLSEGHRDNLDTSCPLSSLMSDVGRSSDEARDVYTARLKKIFDLVETLLPPQILEERRPKVLFLFSACVGAMGLARAVSDPKLSKQILNNVADELIALFPTTGTE